MLVAAMIVCDKKRYSLHETLLNLGGIKEIDRIYLNAQTSDSIVYLPTRKMFDEQFPTRYLDFDFWDITGTSWRPVRKFDQDNAARLAPIVTARNMCIDYAMHVNADYLLFVDSDVLIEPSGVKHLLDLDKPIAGGLVPGRGAHEHVNYVFGKRELQPKAMNVEAYAHGTCGYMLIRKDVFSQLRFRYGPHPVRRDVPLSEDPAYAADAEALGLSTHWYIHRKAQAKHYDDPEHPLTNGEAHEGYSAI